MGFGLTCRFRLFFAMVKIQGTRCMRSHISVHRATTKYFSNSFVFKIKIEKEGLPRDRTPDLGAGGPRFESGRPDQNFSRIFFDLLKVRFTQNSSVKFNQAGGLNSRGALIPKSSQHQKYSKTGRSTSAIQKTWTGGKLNARNLARMEKIQAILRISAPIDLRKCKSATCSVMLGHRGNFKRGAGNVYNTEHASDSGR
jgi:hypothetical protein